MKLAHRHHQTPVRKLSAPVALLAACMAFATPSLASETGHGNHKASAGTHETGEQSTRTYEIMYMENMIDHHNMAIEMAQTCLSKATHVPLQTLCHNIISSQRKEIQTMKGLLAKHYKIAYQAQMSEQDMSKMRALAAMNGSAYEKAFMRQMIQHHWDAIEMTVNDLPHFRTPQLLDLGLDVIGAQAPEIKQMRGWLFEWYKICNVVPKNTMEQQDQ